MQRKQKRFLYTHKIILSIAGLLTIVFALPFLLWLIVPATPLSLRVIDKTTGFNFREHRSIFWLMEHWKYIDPATKTFYNPKKDYYGFFPGDSSFSLVSQLNLQKTDLLYIADTYGVYHYPMDYEKYERTIPDRYVPVTRHYGGLSGQEMDIIEAYDADGGMSLAEFNTLQDPVRQDRETQRRLEKMFGVRFTGALGRYYEDLNTASRWMKDLYEKEQNMRWDISGRGIIISVKRKLGDKRPSIVVLESGDLSHTPVFIHNTDHRFLEQTDDNIPYYYFFEYLNVDSSARVIAQFEIQSTVAGSNKLNNAGLPLSFPAVVVSDSTERKLYFAGDFADNQVETVLMHYWNVEILLSQLFSFYYVSDQTRFFWKFYLPMMNRVYEQASLKTQYRLETEMGGQ